MKKVWKFYTGINLVIVDFILFSYLFYKKKYFINRIFWPSTKSQVCLIHKYCKRHGSMHRWAQEGPWGTGHWVVELDESSSERSSCCFISAVERWPLGLPNLSARWISHGALRILPTAICGAFRSINSWVWRQFLWFLIPAIHGGSRKKSTGLLTTLEALTTLEGRCQGDHDHLEWGHVRTADGALFSIPVRLIQNCCTSVSPLSCLCKLAWAGSQFWDV